LQTFDPEKSKKILEQHLREIGDLRDKITDSMTDLEELENNCREAYDSLEEAIDALSRLS